MAFQTRSVMVAAALLAAAVLCSLSSSASAAVAGEDVVNSLAAPFVDYDAMGNRVAKNWLIGGSAFLNENFLRLTPDRASKRGYAWNTAKLSHPAHTTISVYFRVSGQGKTLFGDGFALWLTNNQRHQDGPLHGFTDTFKGIGIVFDTFRNLESGHIHKDVAVLVNDGTKAISTDSGVEPAGCDGDFRFHEGRDDFSVNSRSAVHITLEAGKLTIRLDSRNTGDLKECVSTYAVPLQGEWWSDLYLGLTSSTGQLADNHDIVSLRTAAGDVRLPERDADTNANPIASTGSQQTDIAIKSMVDTQVKELTKKLQDLDHHVEHQLTAVQDSITNTLKKMQKQEQENLERIEKLEQRLAERMASDIAEGVERRLGKVEAFIEANLAAKLKAEIAPSINQHVADHVGKLQLKNPPASSGGGWHIPFLVLLIVVCGMGGFGYYQYDRMKKTHLL